MSGTGAIAYTGPSWGGISTNNLASTLGVVLESTADVLVPNSLLAEPEAPNEIPVGYLAGAGNLRSDLNWRTGLSGENQRRVRKIHQDRDSEWSGKVSADGYSRLTFSVTKGTTSGTLTLSGAQTQTEALVVETNGQVNLTGTWMGPVTVYGTLGGTGTVSGNLTLSDGATLKVDDLSDTLSVNNLTVGKTVSVYLPATAAAGDTFLSTSTMPDISGTKFNVYVDGNLDKSLYVIATPNGLKIKRGVMFLFH